MQVRVAKQLFMFWTVSKKELKQTNVKPHRLCRYACLTCCFSLLMLCEFILFNIWLVIISEFYISPRRLKWGGWAGVPFWFHCVCPSQSWRARFSQPFANNVQHNVGGKCERIQMLELCNMSQSDCGTHSHVVVCMRCMLRLISPLTAKRKKNSWELMTACAILFLRFVNREGERSVVSVVVFMFWFT